jgi:NAD(P)-dependent dehydrogenase (short-subunit alcohol dehydrogenase family)
MRVKVAPMNSASVSRAVVTGANRGIGLELCKQLAARGTEVVALCRKASADLTALGVIVHEGIDVGDDDVVAELARRLEETSVDLLINNAGILSNESLGDLDFGRIRRQFEVNSLGPLRVTAALASNLSKGAKVAVITSRMGSVADNTSGGMYGYRMSKAAVNMAAVSLAQDMRERGIAVGLFHPGFVKTEMTGGNGMVEAAESAAGLLARIDELSLDSSGSFHHMNGEELPW